MPSPPSAAPRCQYISRTYALRPEQAEWLRDIAARHGLPASGLVRHLIDDFARNYRGVLTLPSTASKEAG